MPSPRTRTESSLRWIAVAGLWANAIFWSLSMIVSSRLPETYHGYRYRHGAPAEWPFPTDEVAKWICAIAVEALFASVLLRRVTGSPAGLCLCTAILYGMATFLMVPLSMHAPTTFATHAISLVFAAGWLIAMGIVSAVVWVVTRYLGDESLEYSMPPEAPPVARIVTGAKASRR